MSRDAQRDDRVRELVERFAGVTVWQQSGKRAPHKPLLLLMALARLQRGESRLMEYGDIEEQLTLLLRDYGPVRPRYQPEYPFWNLQRDGLWDIPERDALLSAIRDRKRQKDVPPAILHAHHAHGGLPQDIDALLRADPQLVHQIAGRLLDDNFPATLHEEILDAVGMPWVVINTRRRKRDPRFREAIMRIYEYRCAVCGYDGRLGHVALNLEAAHVKWHAAGGPDQPDNGIAMCSFHHRAFDRGALGLDSDHRILISQAVHGGETVELWLLRFLGQPLKPPQRGQPLPAAAFMEWHHEQVFHHPARL